MVAVSALGQTILSVNANGETGESVVVDVSYTYTLITPLAKGTKALM